MLCLFIIYFIFRFLYHHSSKYLRVLHTVPSLSFAILLLSPCEICVPEQLAQYHPRSFIAKWRFELEYSRSKSSSSATILSLLMEAKKGGKAFGSLWKSFSKHLAHNLTYTSFEVCQYLGFCCHRDQVYRGHTCNHYNTCWRLCSHS